MKWYVCACLLMTMAVSTCLASDRSRGGIEVFGIAHGDFGTESEDGGATLDMNYGAGIGPGFGINFGPFVNFNVSAVFGRTELEASNDFASADYDKESFGHVSANLEFYPLDNEVTPLIGAGAGVMLFSAEQPDGDEASEADFAYNFTAGVRWDIHRGLFAKLYYRVIFFEFEDTDSTDPMHAVELAVGWRF